jgi:hypothetical protein
VGSKAKAKPKTTAKGLRVAIYHLSAQLVKRSEGRSAVSAAAYRCGLRFCDERTGIIHDFSKKSGVDSFVSLAPENAPDWVFDPCALWNESEKAEKRKDAQVAREINLAIPRELTAAQMKATVVAYVKKTFVSDGMCATVAFHDLESGNPHAHIMLTTRSISADGFGPKNRAWNDVEKLKEWRADWALVANAALELSGKDSRIDERSHAARGITTPPRKRQGFRGYKLLATVVDEAYEYAVEVVADFIEHFQERVSARRSPFDVRPPERPRTPTPPWIKPPH